MKRRGNLTQGNDDYHDYEASRHPLPKKGEEVRTYNIPRNKENEKFHKETVPLCMKIIKRLDEDANVIMYTSTMIFFGILFFIVVFLLTVYFYTQKQKAITKDSRVELEQGSGRGILPPKVVAPSNSAEGQAYIESKENQRNSEPVPTDNEPRFPEATLPRTTVRYVDQYGKEIDPSQLNNYVIQDAL